MLETRRAMRQLEQAREVVAHAEPGDSKALDVGRAHIREAQRLLSSTRTREGRLLYAEALELSVALDSHENRELSIAALIGAASEYLASGSSHEARRGAARVARSLAGVYAGLGMNERAAQFAVEYVQALPETGRDLLAVAYGVCVLAAAGRPEQLKELASHQEIEETAEPIRSILMIVAQRAGYRGYPSQELIAAARRIRYAPADLRVQCVLFAANELVQRGEAEQALELLLELHNEFRSDSLTDARIMQAIGEASARAGDFAASMQYHLLAWSRYDDLRYRFGSLRVRRELDDKLLRSRKRVLASVAAKSDWRSLLELIESCRLQATFNLPGSLDELDRAMATGIVQKREQKGGRSVDARKLPECYQDAVQDLLGPRADLATRVDVYVGGVSVLADARAADGLTDARPRLDVERVLRRYIRPTDMWWSTWYEGGQLYWVLSRGYEPFDGGVIDVLADEELHKSLSLAHLRYRITPPWRVPSSLADVDFAHHLEIADSFEELEETSALMHLLPSVLAQGCDPGCRLLISCAAELAPVPWPILPLDLTTSPVTRLVERFELRFLPSIAVLDRLTVTTSLHGSSELPFLLACDYFPAGGGDPPLARQAQMTLADKQRYEGASNVFEPLTTNLARFLRYCPPGNDGVAFFRAHYDWVQDDPTSSGLALADGVFPTGMLAAHDENSDRLLCALPSTVVMSCCSTSGLRERHGGETLGFAPVAMLAGASRLILTSVNIEHTPFTVALDDMLLEVAMQRGDHFVALRRLQLRLLDEWRRYSLRYVESLRDVTPLPTIWAHYQAFGV